jgi:hypothetical protein
VEAYREPAFGVAHPAARTGQRDRFRPSELTLVELGAEGRTGLPILGLDHLRVPARLADPSAASADRTLQTRARFPAVGELDSDQLRCRPSAAPSKAEPMLTKGTCVIWTPHRAGRARELIHSSIRFPPMTGGAGAAAVEPSRSSIQWRPRRRRPGVPHSIQAKGSRGDGNKSVRA